MVTFNLKLKEYSFKVKVFNTKADMVKYYVSKKHQHHEFDAVTLKFDNRKVIAELLFYKNYFFIEVILHEIIHAAIWYASCLSKNHKIKNLEENICYSVSNLFRLFMKKIRKI